MCLNIRAHFDGRALIPDQPVDLPLNQPLDIEITQARNAPAVNGAAASSTAEIQDSIRKVGEFFRRPPLGQITAEALRRENLYNDERT